jgi:hypothetical protein
MKCTKVLKNGGDLAVRTRIKSPLPADDGTLMERDAAMALISLDDKGWPSDLETRFEALADLELPIRPMDSKPIGF